MGQHDVSSHNGSGSPAVVSSHRAATVLVTRPAHQSEPLARQLAEAGLIPLRYPTLDIGPASDPAKLRAVIDFLPQADLVVFISPNAVHYGMAAIRAQLGDVPGNPQIACVGAGSARALADAGLINIITPAETFNSEALLALPELQSVEGWQVVIFRGNGGRDTLKTTLEARGARVRYAECYCRFRPDSDTDPLEHWLQQGKPDVITVTSSEALRNLVELTPAPLRTALVKIPLIVISPRIAAVAKELGFTRIEITRSAGDDAIVAAAAALFHQ